MRQHVVGRMIQSDQLERSKMYKTMALQVAIVLALAIVCLLIKGAQAFFAVSLGGLSLILPSFVFFTLMFFVYDPRAPKRLAILFFIGEFIKLLTSAGLLAFVILHMPGELMPIVVGFFAALISNWLAPFLMTLTPKKVTGDF